MNVIRGYVIKGKGGYGKAPHSPKVAACFENTPIRGTLNVALDQPVRLRHGAGNVEVLNSMFWPSYIQGIPCLIMRTPHTPLHIVEVISDVRLPYSRGDRISLVIPRGCTLDLPPNHRKVWALFYGLGRTRWYEYKIYRRLLGPFYFVRRLSIQDPNYSKSGTFSV